MQLSAQPLYGGSVTDRDAKYRAEYFERALDPESWRQSAHQLMEAAALIEPKLAEFWAKAKDAAVPASSWRPWDDEFLATYFMLASFAVENALKARLVELNLEDYQRQIKSTRKLPRELTGHNLYELCVAADLQTLANEEEDLLRRLERSAVWYGRYPIPIRSADLNTQIEAKSRDGKISLTMYTSSDPDWIRRILTELKVQAKP